MKAKPTLDTREQDPEAHFQEIYQQYKRKVLNTALNMVHDLQDAEEITQDVFVELYFNLPRFRGDSTLSTWIYRITVNKSLDLIKKKKRKKRFGWLTGLFDETSGKELHVVSDFIHPGVQLENQEEMSKLFAAIDRLPEKQKTALVLSVMEQLSYEEISQVMEASISSVESLIFRARQNLKKEMGNNQKKKDDTPQVTATTVV
ncbi:MAG TPA: sigma-70 family RNA polymerase sigma factor [Cytophagaceae bacterium]|nr:sigma-70 family RNA polymerase sigma factor [Cytophagaceae bacterium]